VVPDPGIHSIKGYMVTERKVLRDVEGFPEEKRRLRSWRGLPVFIERPVVTHRGFGRIIYEQNKLF
jgi:hypothetical protein